MKTANLVDAKTGLYIAKITMEALDAFLERREVTPDMPTATDMALALRALLEERRWEKARIAAQLLANERIGNVQIAVQIAEQLLVECGL